METKESKKEEQYIDTEYIEEGAKIILNQKDAVRRAIDRWIHFYERMHFYSVQLKKDVEKYYLKASIFKVTTIIFSTSLTVIAGFKFDCKDVFVGVFSGIIALATSLEAYFKYFEKYLSTRHHHREVSAIRDNLAYSWMSKVELEIDSTKKLEQAKIFFESGPKMYNDELDKYNSKINEEEAKERA